MGPSPVATETLLLEGWQASTPSAKNSEEADAPEQCMQTY